MSNRLYVQLHRLFRHPISLVLVSGMTVLSIKEMHICVAAPLCVLYNDTVMGSNSNTHKRHPAPTMVPCHSRICPAIFYIKVKYIGLVGSSYSFIGNVHSPPSLWYLVTPFCIFKCSEVGFQRHLPIIVPAWYYTSFLHMSPASNNYHRSTFTALPGRNSIDSQSWIRSYPFNPLMTYMSVAYMNT